jgi:hypothetical protein
MTLGKADVTGIDFLVLSRPKTVDIRGYLSILDGINSNDECPEERVKNISVELKKISSDPNEEDVIYPLRKMLMSCQFIMTKLEKAEYSIKLIEKQGKTLTKVISEETIDLNDDKDISDGVRLHNVKLEKKKTSLQENLNNSIFSPIIIVILLIALIQWNNTVWLMEKGLSYVSGRKY